MKIMANVWHDRIVLIASNDNAEPQPELSFAMQFALAFIGGSNGGK